MESNSIPEPARLGGLLVLAPRVLRAPLLFLFTAFFSVGGVTSTFFLLAVEVTFFLVVVAFLAGVFLAGVFLAAAFFFSLCSCCLMSLALS